MTQAPFTINAIIYQGFEMLDLFGPLEMFSMLGPEQVSINMVAGAPGSISTAMGADIERGPKVLAEYGFSDAPRADMLLIPGGFGTLPALQDEALMNYLHNSAADARFVASVCTGSALLARSGLLDGHRATSNKQLFALAVAQSDKVDWQERARWVEDGKFYTSSGVSAGMDMSFAIITARFGAEAADTVARSTEYTRHEDADDDPFASELNALAGVLGMS